MSCPVTYTRRSFVRNAALCSVALALTPSFAFADENDARDAQSAQRDADAVREKLVSLQAELEEASEKYNIALAEQQAAEEAKNQAQSDIDATTASINKLSERLGNRANTMYRTGPSGALDYLLKTTTFEEFAENWDMLKRLNREDADLIGEQKALREQLQAQYEEYAEQESIAAEKAQEAAQVKADVETRIAEAEALIAELDAEAQGLLEEQAAASAAAIANAHSVPTYRWSGDPDDNATVVNYAREKLGCPYIWGAAGPDTFDCSGLVVWAYAQIGKSLPHYTESLYAAAKNIVPISEARPGDVLYRYGHVGIAEAEGGVPYIHAPTFNAVVRDTDPLSWAGFTCALQF